MNLTKNKVRRCYFTTKVVPSLWRNRLEADWGSEGMGVDPHSGKSEVRLFSLSILIDKLFWWFRVVLLHQLVRWYQYNVTSRP
jgi:hypothetical protein